MQVKSATWQEIREQKQRLEDMRCFQCKRLLQRIDRDALRPGYRLEIKCVDCKSLNYRVGA